MLTGLGANLGNLFPLLAEVTFDPVLPLLFAGLGAVLLVVDALATMEELEEPDRLVLDSLVPCAVFGGATGELELSDGEGRLLGYDWFAPPLLLWE